MALADLIDSMKIELEQYRHNALVVEDEMSHELVVVEVQIRDILESRTLTLKKSVRSSSTSDVTRKIMKPTIASAR